MRASATSVTVPASASTVTVGSTCVSGSECASGISSSVRLAAWIAASRATVATSPFGASPGGDARRGLGRHPHDGAGARPARGLVLGADVDHAGVARGVEVGERALHTSHNGTAAVGSGAVRISVRLFAGLRERAGADRVELDLPDDAAGGATCWPRWGCSRGSASSRSTASTPRADEPVRPTHEVALIPPVSGGAETRCGSSTSPTSRSTWRTVAAAVRDPRAGAVVCFEGVTREVEALDYEAYVEMARAKLRGDRRARRPRGTGCARSRSSTASAACR